MLTPHLSEWIQMRILILLHRLLDPKVSHLGVLSLPFLDDALELLHPKGFVGTLPFLLSHFHVPIVIELR